MDAQMSIQCVHSLQVITNIDITSARFGYVESLQGYVHYSQNVYPSGVASGRMEVED